MRGVLVTMVAVLCAALASSCGSGSGGVASCGKVSPCGGDPVGAWKFTSQCVNDLSDFTDNFCPTATASLSGASASGTATFSADGTYSLNFMQSGTIQVTLPPACLKQGTLTLTCPQLQQLLQATFADDPDAPFTNVTCSGAGACSCSMTLTTTTADTGTWLVDGTTLSLSGGESGGEFCVKDKELHLIDVDTTMTMGTMGEAKITSDVVAVKQ